jgi:drug/metabolite transporter (DMT)-like permease
LNAVSDNSIRKTEKTGELIAFSKAVIWGFFPIFAIVSFESIPVIYSVAFSTLLSALIFIPLLLFTGKLHELRNRSAWPSIFKTSIINGVFYYLLIFAGTSMTSAGNASTLGQIEILASIVILRLWGKELLVKREILGAILMMIGAVIVIFPKDLSFNKGDFLIILANFLTPFGNYHAQNARKFVSSLTILSVRSIFGGSILLALAYFLQPVPNLNAIFQALPSLMITGLIMLGFTKILWIEAIHRISISKTLAILAIAPVFTLIGSYLILNDPPTVQQLCGLPIMFCGVLALTILNRKN